MRLYWPDSRRLDSNDSVTTLADTTLEPVSAAAPLAARGRRRCAASEPFSIRSQVNAAARTGPLLGGADEGWQIRMRHRSPVRR